MKNSMTLLRKIVIAAMVFCITGTAFAQVEKTVTLDASTDLATALTALGTDITTITKLTILKEPDALTEYTMDNSAILRSMTALEELDLSKDEITINFKGYIFRDASPAIPLKKISFSKFLTSIDSNAFVGLAEMEEVEIAEGNPNYTSSGNILVDLVTPKLFYCPPGIKEAIVDGSLVTETPAFRFFGAALALEKFVFTEGFTTIPDHGIRLNSSENLDQGSGALTEIYFPSTITDIGGNAFCRRGNVKLIVCRATALPTCGGNAFYDVGASLTPSKVYDVYVPATSLDTYKAGPWGGIPAANFKAFYNISITDDNGTIESPIGTDIAYDGATVTITAATAPAGQIFDKWDASSTGIVAFAGDDNTLASTTITMPAADVVLTATYKADQGLSIQNTESNNVAIYPNPATDYITITGMDEGVYTIYNILGSIVAQGTLTGKAISVSSLENGTYIFKTGDKVIRFIKK